MVNSDTINDCVASWLTATGFIRRDEYVTLVNPNPDIEMPGYLIEVKDAKEEA